MRPQSASSGSCPPLGRGQTQPSRAQPVQQFATADLNRTCGHDFRPELLRDVVVIALESAQRDIESTSEVVQFFDALVTDQMTPSPSLPVPEGVIDENRHGARRGRDDCAIDLSTQFERYTRALR